MLKLKRNLLSVAFASATMMLATGAQARDANCRYLRLVVDGANVSTRSGSTESTDNAPQSDRKCWNV